MSKSGEANIPAAAVKKWGSTAAAAPATGKRGGRRATSKSRRTRAAAAAPAATAPIKCSLSNQEGEKNHPSQVRMDRVAKIIECYLAVAAVMW
jgi:hypothetical protein